MMITTNGGDPDAMDSVLTLAALGLTNRAWRNTCVENWHAGAGSRLSDADMLRINAWTSHGVRQRVRGWRAECGLHEADADVLDEAEPEDVDRLATRVFAWLTNPNRRLPTGTTLAALAGADLEEYADAADRALSGFAELAEEHGAAFALRRAAAHGAGACHAWWGHPSWPARTDRFLSALDDPADAHWRPDGERLTRIGPAPASMQDHAALRDALLRAPWELDSDSAAWIIQAGIGYLHIQGPDSGP